jgi:phosphodiesterase/alkaline phosphatase D-like protein
VPHATPVAPGTGSAVLNMTARINPNAANFPVTVCEALYPSTIQRYTVTGVVTSSPIVLPGAAVGASPSRIVAFGDSGCRNYANHACDSASWPRAATATLAASKSPQLLIHVGDYNYSGTPSKVTINENTVRVYDAGDSGD